MNDSERINPGHTTLRGKLRIIGPVVFLVGLICAIVAAASLFIDSGNFTPDRYFWLGFVGLPLMFVGGVISMTAFIGAIARFEAAEAAPVAKDTFNYMATGVKPGIRDVTQAMAEGFAAAGKAQYCNQCGAANDLDAKFCKSCGRAMAG